MYRKPTQTDTTIHFTYNHPLEHKVAAYNFYVNRMLLLPFTEQAKQQEWNIMCTIARNNGFQLQIIHNLRRKKNPLTQTQLKKWITFTYFSPCTHKVTNLFKNTDLNVSFRTCNTIYNQLCDRIPLNKINSSGIHILQCKTCNKSYVGQTGRLIEIRLRECIITLSQHMHYTVSTTDVSMVLCS